MSLTLTKVSEDYSTSPQIQPVDIAEIAQLGFKTIINNRPDAEGGSEQPISAALETEAKRLGIAYVHIPVIPNQIQPEQVVAFQQAFNAAEKPVVGFCRTGNRAMQMYHRAHASAQPLTSPSAFSIQSLLAWLKSKCLITRLIRWVKAKYA